MNIEKLLQISEAHGLSAELDDEVGDLRELVRIAWEQLSPEAQAQAWTQMIEFLAERTDASEEALLERCCL